MAACTSAPKQGLPAGPAGIPVLGAALKWKGPETNLEWTKEYGPIYSVRIGPNQLVYLNTIELVEEYMERKGDACLGRPVGPAAIANGLLFGQGDPWRANRRAFVRAMWRSSLGRPYEALIHGQVDLVSRQLEQQLDTPLELDTFLLPALTDRLVALLLGRPLPRDSDDRTTLVQQMRNMEDVDLTSKSTQMFLKVKHFRRPLEAVSGRTIPDMFKMSEAMQAVIRGWVRQRRAALEEAGGQTDPDVLLDQLLTAPEFATCSDDQDKELVQSIMDLFNGGVTSSLSALEFAIIYFIHHPEVQAKVKAEVDRVTGEGTPLSWANRDRFPYSHATLVEVLRLGSVTPSSLPHVATEDMVIEDQYEVPKDVFVLAGIYSLHRDPRFYSQPELFRPDRHIDLDGKVVTPRSYRPFGIGERMCLGYNLAEMELFLFMTRLASTFRFLPEVPDQLPPIDTLMRVVRRLKPFACVLKHWDT